MCQPPFCAFQSEFRAGKSFKPGNSEGYCPVFMKTTDRVYTLVPSSQPVNGLIYDDMGDLGF